LAHALTIEMAPFVLADGVTVETLLEASERLERDFLSGADGYIGRVLVKKDRETWADIVFWESHEQAMRAMEAAVSSEACNAYFQCMAAANHDDPGQGVMHFESVKTYGSAPI
jgi:hypothetical protein